MDENGDRSKLLVVEGYRGIHVRNEELIGPVLQRGWKVSLLTSGLLVTVLKTERDAKRAAEEFHKWFSDAVGLKYKDEVVSALPDWAGTWCTEMRTTGKYLPPPVAN